MCSVISQHLGSVQSSWDPVKSLLISWLSEVLRHISYEVIYIICIPPNWKNITAALPQPMGVVKHVAQLNILCKCFCFVPFFPCFISTIVCTVTLQKHLILKTEEKYPWLWSVKPCRYRCVWSLWMEHFWMRTFLLSMLSAPLENLFLINSLKFLLTFFSNITPRL